MHIEDKHTKTMEEKNEIILYQPEESVKLEVRFENETVWLNRLQIAELFGRDVKTIGKHIANALKEELKGISVVAKFATTATDGKIYQVEYYSLDMILSIGYRVKSQRGIQFRQWASTVLKDYLLKGYSINQRIERLEKTVADHSEKIDFFVRTSLPPVEGIFFEGQIFDAYVFAAGLIKSAKQSIVLIDNYIDESVFTLLSKRDKGVSAIIYTNRVSSQLQLDIKRYNTQYPAIEVLPYMHAHDRFLIIDSTVYHIGASLKDLGKKLFAFSKMSIPTDMILNKIQEIETLNYK